MANNDTVEWRLLGTNLTTVLAILPAVDSHLYLELNEPGSGNLKIPLTSTAAGQVTSGMFCECYYRGASRGGFFVDNLKETNADGAEAGGKWMSISGRGALALLEDAIVWDNGSDTTERTFTGQTRGYIMKTLIDEAQARGGLSALSYNFSATLDSASASWTDSDDYEFPVGSSLLDVLREFSADGTDFTIALSAGSFVLSAWQADYGTDRSSTIYMRVGSNCEEVSKDQRGEPIKNVIRVKHKGGYITVSDSTSITANRRRETLLNLEAAQSGSSASTYASVKLNNVKNPQISLAVRVYDGVNPRLFVDYNIGDTVTIDKQGTQISYRVLGVQIDFSEKQFADVTLETNSIIRENELNFERDINSLLKRWNTARDADQTEVMQWMPIGGDALGYVYDSFIQGGELYICGNFTGISGKLTSTNKVFKYNFASGAWSAVGDTSSFATDPRRIQVTSDGSTIYAMNTTEVWKKTGSGAWTRVGLTAAGTFYDILLWDSSNPNYSGVVVAGIFTDAGMGVGGGESGGLSVYDGSTWRNLTVYMARIMVEYSLALNGSSLMVGGYRTVISDEGEIQGLRTDLTSYYVFNSTTGRAPVRSIHFSATNDMTYIDTSGKIYQGTVTPGTPHDSFTNIGTVDTFTDSAIITGIYSYLNDIYIHGYMDGVDGVVSHSVIRYSGGNWESVDGGTTGTGDFISTVIFNGDNMIVGGQFDTIGGITIDNLAIHIVDFADLIDMISKAGSMDHNSLNGIQGGSSNSYYHFTSAQHTDLTDSGDSTLHYHASDRDSANFTGTDWTDLTDGNGTTLHTHAYTALTSKPKAETNANDVFGCGPAGVSAFVGTIATLPGGATLTYNVTSGNEAAMVPSLTSLLAKMVLYNTTRGTSALISNCVTGTNTITLTANVPAGWQVGDTINIASLTVSGGGFSWVDLEFTSVLTGKTNVFLNFFINSATVGDTMYIHPLETYGASKLDQVTALMASVWVPKFSLLQLINNKFSVAWTGTPAGILLKEAGYLE